ISTVDVLHVQLKNLDLLHQSTRGFLAKIFVDLQLARLTEHRKLAETEYRTEIYTKKANETESAEEDAHDRNRVTVRIDSFNKGTAIHDELVSVRVRGLSQQLAKETLDLLVEFVTDHY